MKLWSMELNSAIPSSNIRQDILTFCYYAGDNLIDVFGVEEDISV